MTRRKVRQLSELEGVCLGIVFRQQPCTAYQVRCELRKAPSSHWRASAGSVYPLLARLARERLLTEKSDSSDGRGRTQLCISARGKSALKGWLVAGTDQELISSVSDPVRSRTFFLDVLPVDERTAYLDKLTEQLEHYLSLTEAHLDDESCNGNSFDALGALGAVRITEARLAWLREIRLRLSGASADPG